MVIRSVWTLVLLCVAVPAAAQNMVTVTETASVWLRPTEQGTVLETLAAGARVEVLPTVSPDPQWHKVKLPGVFPRVGYLPIRFTAAADHTAPAAPAVAVVATPSTAPPLVKQITIAPATESTPPRIPAPAPSAAAPVVAVAMPVGPAPAPVLPSRNTSPTLMTKGNLVTLRVPISSLAIDGASLSGVAIYAGNVSAGLNGRLTVGGSAEWQTAGFPPLAPYKVEKVSKKPTFTEVELRSAWSWVKLRFLPHIANVGAAFDALVLPGGADTEQARQFRSEAYTALGAKVFTGALQAIPADVQRRLIEFAHTGANANGVRQESYKEKPYLVLDLGRDSNVYNDLKFSQPSLVAHVFNEQLLKMLRSSEAPAQGTAPLLHGIKLEYSVPHMSFLDKTVPPQTYNFDVYVPLEQLKKFVDADITNQQFVDACVVLVNDSRVQVSLSNIGS